MPDQNNQQQHIHPTEAQIRQIGKSILEERMKQRRGLPFVERSPEELDWYYNILHEQHLRQQKLPNPIFKGERRQPEYLAKMAANKAEDRKVAAAAKKARDQNLKAGANKAEDRKWKVAAQAAIESANDESKFSNTSSVGPQRLKSTGIWEGSSDEPYEYDDMAPTMYSKTGDARLAAFRAAREATKASYDALIQARSVTLNAAKEGGRAPNSLTSVKVPSGDVEMADAIPMSVEDSDSEVSIADLVNEHFYAVTLTSNKK